MHAAGECIHIDENDGSHSQAVSTQASSVAWDVKHYISRAVYICEKQDP